jgi:hypothetical protein
MYQARTDRITILNEFLGDTFVRTRAKPPAFVVLDIDPTDDPTHGQQALSAYHGYYQQQQYFPLLVFEGVSRFPLAAWLRPGASGGACGAVDVLRQIVNRLRQAWPDVTLLVRGDCSMAGPAVYAFCEAEGLLYACGYASNALLQRRTERALWELQEYDTFYRHREPQVQRFEVLEDYLAEGWSRGRRIVCKVECTPQGSQHGLDLGRLSAHGFRANAYRLLHVVAYGLVVLLREALAAVPEVAQATVSRLRHRLWKMGAWVERKGARCGSMWRPRGRGGNCGSGCRRPKRRTRRRCRVGKAPEGQQQRRWVSKGRGCRRQPSGCDEESARRQRWHRCRERLEQLPTGPATAGKQGTRTRRRRQARSGWRHRLIRVNIYL